MTQPQTKNAVKGSPCFVLDANKGALLVEHVATLATLEDFTRVDGVTWNFEAPHTDAKDLRRMQPQDFLWLFSDWLTCDVLGADGTAPLAVERLCRAAFDDGETVGDYSDALGNWDFADAAVVTWFNRFLDATNRRRDWIACAYTLNDMIAIESLSKRRALAVAAGLVEVAQ